MKGVCRVSGPISLKPEKSRSTMQKTFENRLRVSMSKINLNPTDLNNGLNFRDCQVTLTLGKLIKSVGQDANFQYLLKESYLQFFEHGRLLTV